jgi:nucleoside phosphorylase
MQFEEFSVGIICPLPIEVAAMSQMLDEHYSTQKFPRDPNLYRLGRIGEHKVVIAGLPEGLTGIASATTVAERLWTSFHAVKALLLVGIGGGVPTTKNDMRLGDVVVSCPDGKYGGVVQYDFGKSLSEGRFEHIGALNSPPREVLATLAAMKANHLINGTRPLDYLTYLEASQSNPYLKYPGVESDTLFEANYNHVSGSDCTSCDKAKEIKRKPRKANGPVIHYGTIASANQLMRDSKKRDSYSKDYDSRILCFEMEAAGLMNSTPCLIIRGISDYADSHKREDHAWHGYAAATAAAFAKEFINTIPSSRLKSMSTVATNDVGKTQVVQQQESQPDSLLDDAPSLQPGVSPVSSKCNEAENYQSTTALLITYEEDPSCTFVNVRLPLCKFVSVSSFVANSY